MNTVFAAPEKTRQTHLILALFITVVAGLNGMLLVDSWQDSQKPYQLLQNQVFDSQPLSLQEEADRMVDNLYDVSNQASTAAGYQANQWARDFEGMANGLMDEMNIQFQKLNQDFEQTASSFLQSLNQQFDQFKK